jgi:hypothetical protein
MVARSGGPNWSLADARQAVKLEVTVDANGARQETEYHVDPSGVPDAVKQAMDARHPGGAYIGAEKEWNGGRLYWELAREVNGFEVEAMFTPSGQLYSEEIQIPEDEVPAAVKDAIATTWPAGSVKHYEMIRDGSGTITEYHVKLDAAGQALKIVVSTGGTIKAGYREVPAEIEVPIAIPR